MRYAKPRARFEASAEEWQVLIVCISWLQEGTCACGCNRPIESHHHLVTRSQGGDDVLSNLVGLYGDGTRGCHGALTSGNRTFDRSGAITPDGVRSGIRRNMRLDQIVYIINRTGEWYLQKHYPE